MKESWAQRSMALGKECTLCYLQPPIVDAPPLNAKLALCT